MGICCSAKKTKAGAGRPRDPAKDDAILAAARDSFFERGVAASTIEDIAQRAGVSKVTVYSRFGDKETLFETIVRAETGKMAETLDAGGAGLTVVERLNAFGATLLGHLFAPDHVMFDRVVIGDLMQNRKLAERFFAAGPAQCRARLADVVAEAQDKGMIAVDDVERAAGDLISLWKGFADAELKFGMVKEMDCAAITARVERGTKLFLRAYRPDGVLLERED